jgi:hypothetical protein
MATALSKSAWSRPAALLCCLLTLLAALDPWPFLQALLAPAAAAQGLPPAPEDDDDEMLDLAGSTAGPRASRRENRGPPAARPAWNPLPKCFHVHSPDRARLIASPCEHDFRNGIGAPLRC